MDIQNIMGKFNDIYIEFNLNTNLVESLFPELNIDLPCSINKVFKYFNLYFSHSIDNQLEELIYNLKPIIISGQDNHYILQALKHSDNKLIFHLYQTNDYVISTLNNIEYQLDPLTNVFHKNAIERVINHSINTNPTNVAVMFMIDIDYFKNINDTYGHIFGDEVIQAIAKALNKISKYKMSIGRIGGDEFIVYIEHNLDRIGIKEIARQIRYQLDNLVIRSKLFSITATIGISQYPKDGNDFKSLYQACDKALYRGKDKGRDCHIIYDKNIHFGDIDEHHLSNDNLVVNRLSLSNFIGILVKNLLDPNMNINNIFEMIANYFNLDRILVLKSSDIISIYSKDKKNLKFEKFNIEEYKKYFVVDDILCINDTKTWRIKDETMYNTYKKYNTAALIQSLMKNSEGDIIGLLSFEMTTMKRVWQRSEINAMAIVSKILNVFLIK